MSDYDLLLERWKEEQQKRLAAEAEIERLKGWIESRSEHRARALKAEARVEQLRNERDHVIRDMKRLLEECEKRSVRQSEERQLADRLAAALREVVESIGPDPATAVRVGLNALAAHEEVHRGSQNT